MKTFIRIVYFIIISTCWQIRAQMLADITSDVITDFATFHPCMASFTPQIPPYSLAENFSNVCNFDRFQSDFDAYDLDLLRRNHFAVKKSRYMQLYDIYNESTYDATPIFVTADAVLHIYHVLYDKMLAKIEMNKFITALSNLTDELIQQTETVLHNTENANVAEAARHNLAYLYVARKLLPPVDVAVPASVWELVDSELTLIAAHDGFHFSPVLGSFSMLDYSQFKPRGHYTQNDTLRAYFKTMMWYGWTIFTMEPDLFGPLSRRHTLQALMLTQQLFKIQNNMALWEAIYLPTVFFVGKTDDPNVFDYKDIADMVYGPEFINLPPEQLADSLLLDQFMAQACQLQPPAIPNWIYGSFATYKGFRFMGQRFIPDSYMFAHLIDPYVSLRWMPKGLDIMAILGSERAFAILDSVYHEPDYANYNSQIEKFHSEYAQKPASDWAQNLYWNWLYCLMPLLYEKSDGYPYFMRRTAWADKELYTALASWAELRHDTILYAKQSMTPCCIPPGPPRSYVEPNPYLYARLAALVKFTRDGLHNRDLLLEDFREKLDLYESLLLFLRDIAIKELENSALSDGEYANIFCFGNVMEQLVTETPDPDNPWDTDTDDMAVIADVHTDSNTDLCLEEAVGYPLEIYVIVPQGDTLRMTQGAIFSYYEFNQPIAQRLTDEEWRTMLNTGTQPDLPLWSNSFMDIKAPSPPLISGSIDNIYGREFTYESSETPEIRIKTYQLFQNYPNPFNPITMINYQLPMTSEVELNVYNLLGQRVATLVSEWQHAGSHQAVFNAQGLPSGIYFYRIEAGAFHQVKKMILVR
jgi:hypothetical protein